MENEKKILKLFENGYLTTKSIVNNGIPRIYLTKLVKNGVIERVSRGIYVKKDVLVDEFVILQSKSKYAIYSNTTALYLYGFSNRIPIKYDITVKNGYKGSLQKEDNVNLFYTKKELLDLGVINYKLDSGNVIRLYDLDKTIEEKVETIAKKVYGADGVDFTEEAQAQIAKFNELGWDKLPICMAKTQMSLSDDGKVMGRPTGFRITVRELRPSLGAGFIVALTGKVLTMPGLPKHPSALDMDVDENGKIVGLF